MKSRTAATVEITRGGWVESAHTVDIVVADADGYIVSVWGEAERLIFPRSSVKALQALPLIESGASQAYGFDDAQLALACASHNGEDVHVDCATDMLRKSGLSSACLECGAQLPRFPEDQVKLKDGATPTHNNCSGKHAGFLAFANHSGMQTKGYIDISHPVQGAIAGVMEEVCDHPHRADNHGIDGCSIPTYTMPLKKLAIAFAKFGVGNDRNIIRSRAMLTLRDACMKHPEMVAGSKRVCTQLMQALGTRAFVKVGAEGIYTASLPELGFGIAMKTRDGNYRACELAVSTVISRYLELTEPQTQAMKPLLEPVIKNWNNMEVGTARISL